MPNGEGYLYHIIRWTDILLWIDEVKSEGGGYPNMSARYDGSLYKVDDLVKLLLGCLAGERGK
jgi:hypothetical protein